MLKEDCFFLGSIVGKYSFKGEILAKLDTDNPQQYKEINSVLIDTSLGLVPYFIDRSRLHKSSLMTVVIMQVIQDLHSIKQQVT